MPNTDLHGSAPDSSVAALLLIDVINDLEFEGGEKLLPHAIRAAGNIRRLKGKAIAEGIPVVYANDNFGRWRSDFREVVAHTLNDGVRGAPLTQLLHPGEADYFVLKPKHSAFFATTLETLLEYLGTRRLIIAGYAGDICIMLSAADAYMRDFELFVPSDCVASEDTEANEMALAYMERILGADIRPSPELDLVAISTPESRSGEKGSENEKGSSE